MKFFFFFLYLSCTWMASASKDEFVFNNEDLIDAGFGLKVVGVKIKGALIKGDTRIDASPPQKAVYKRYIDALKNNKEDEAIQILQGNSWIAVTSLRNEDGHVAVPPIAFAVQNGLSALLKVYNEIYGKEINHPTGTFYKNDTNPGQSIVEEIGGILNNYECDFDEGIMPIPYLLVRNHCGNYPKVDVQEVLKLPGLNVNKKVEHSFTALHYAIDNNVILVIEALARHPGINLNALLDSGLTPLAKACMHGKARIVEILANAGADINFANPLNGLTPLMLSTMHGHLEIVKFLLEKGALKYYKSPIEGDYKGMYASGFLYHSVAINLSHDASERLNKVYDMRDLFFKDLFIPHPHDRFPFVIEILALAWLAMDVDRSDFHHPNFGKIIFERDLISVSRRDVINVSRKAQDFAIPEFVREKYTRLSTYFKEKNRSGIFKLLPELLTEVMYLYEIKETLEILPEVGKNLKTINLNID